MNVQQTAIVIKTRFQVLKQRPEQVASFSGLSVSTLYKILAAAKHNSKSRIDPESLQGLAKFFAHHNDQVALDALASYALGMPVTVVTDEIART